MEFRIRGSKGIMQIAGPPSLLAGRYRLDKRRATGGYGEVWRAVDTLLQRTVAVKLLRAEISGDSDTQARFRSEARHAGSVTHENIAQIYDYCEPGPDQPAFLVMEYVDGPSLAEVLVDGPLEPVRVMDVVAQCAAGLQAAHQAGLVHRDIKPGNVLTAEGGRVKLTDFGISHVAGSVSDTATGTLIGTPAYLAPERANGTRGTSSSDLYALGVLAYQCLTGEVPFSGDPLQVALAHCTDPLPPLPGNVPAGVAALVGALTAKDPADRPESAAAVGAWAAGLRDQQRTSAPGLADTAEDAGALAPAFPGVPGAEVLAPPTRTDRVSHRRWRLYAVLLPAAAIVAALTAVLLISMFDQSPQHVAAAGPSHGAMVRVDGKTLLGKPVPAVRRQLRHLGLDVQVRWQRSNRMPPGRVLSVKPAGLVPRESTVVLVGTLAPGPAGPGTPTSPGHHGRSGNFRHHGGRSHHGGQPPPTGKPTPTGSPTPTSSPTPTVSPTPTPNPSTTPTPAGQARG
jgi:eukaryotic-like serine/threonine-protein kinase